MILAASWFIDGCTEIATRLNVPKFIIGSTIIAVGTSAPEFLISVTAGLNNTPLLALGNAVGSNIANIAIIAGTLIVFTPKIIENNLSWND